MTSYTSLRVVQRESGLACGWCHKTIIEGPAPLSHGICGPCTRKHFPEMEAA